MPSFEELLEKRFEPLLWKTRYFILISVLCSILTGVALIVLVGLLDLTHFIGSMWEYLQVSISHSTKATPSMSPLDARNNLTFTLVEMIDTFLMAGVLFIFGFGLYELFISRISPASGCTPKSKILNIRNIDELKSKLAKVILMILIVKCFYYTVKLPQENFESVTDVVWLAAVIALIGLALFLSHSSQNEIEDENIIKKVLPAVNEKDKS